MNKEFPELQKLLELRGRTAPQDEYFEEFLDEFHRRQRQDLMKRSARSLLVERLTVWFREMGSAKWAYAAGGAYAVLMVLFFAWPKGPAAEHELEPASFEQMPLIEEKVLQFGPTRSEAADPSTSTEF